MKRILYLLAFATMWGCNGKKKKQTLTMTTENTVMVVVDVQNDFFKEGSLETTADKNYASLVEKKIDKYQNAGYHILFTQDWHPKGHISFGLTHVQGYTEKNFKFNSCTPQYVYLKRGESSVDYSTYEEDGKTLVVYDLDQNGILYKEVPDFVEGCKTIAESDNNRHFVKFEDAENLKNHIQQRLWTEHCVQDDPGAALVGDLEGKIRQEFRIKKGMNVNADSYSGVKDDGDQKTDLLSKLEAKLGEGKTGKTVVVFGVATDVCVKATAMDLKKAGYHVIVISDLSRGVTEKEPSDAIQDMKEKSIEVISLEELESLLGLTATK